MFVEHVLALVVVVHVDVVDVGVCCSFVVVGADLCWRSVVVGF